MPLRWDEVNDCEPADFTLLTAPKRFADLGDAHAEMDAHAGSLELLLELAARDEAAGLGDAPWPPHFVKMAGEAPRVQPSRSRSTTKTPAKAAQKKSPRVRMPLLVIANSPSKEAALAGLERWKRKHRKVVKFLAADDILVDSMRGRSSTWTRIRINLRNIPEDLRPAQATPDPDDDPTREWRASKQPRS
jgi:bifunctional non-homologous end joining protein LigD